MTKELTALVNAYCKKYFEYKMDLDEDDVDKYLRQEREVFEKDDARAELNQLLKKAGYSPQTQTKWPFFDYHTKEKADGSVESIIFGNIFNDEFTAQYKEPITICYLPFEKAPLFYSFLSEWNHLHVLYEEEGITHRNLSTPNSRKSYLFQSSLLPLAVGGFLGLCFHFKNSWIESACTFGGITLGGVGGYLFGKRNLKSLDEKRAQLIQEYHHKHEQFEKKYRPITSFNRDALEKIL